MEVARKSLLITDPGYIAKKDDWGKSWDLDKCTIDQENITDYIWESTGQGDGSWEVYEISGFETKESLISFVKKLTKATSLRRELLFSGYPYNQIGTFSADSGNSGVFILNEVYEYNPDWKKDIAKGCYAEIQKYTGEVDFFRDDDNNLHLIGFNKTGTSFFTI